jgi:hypothetical protein
MSSIKELVKKHFNLVEARQSFGEVMTADGELTLTYEGDELAQGLAVFVVTADGNVPAPDGEHALEGGVTIVTMNGKIEAIKETVAEAPAEEVAAKKHDDKMMEESPVEAVAAVVEDAISEEVVEAVAEAVIEAIGEMMKKMEDRMAALEGKFSTFASAPAAEKTNAGKSSTTKFNSDLAPSRNKALVDKFIALKNKK